MEGVIPYWTLPTLDIGPVALQPFGMLVATGVLFGAWIGRLRAEQLGVDDDSVRILTGYLLVFGFLGAHLFDVFMYQPGKLKEDPLLLIKIWAGISSYGGFLGAVVGWWLFCWRHRAQSKMVIADITIVGTLPGFTFGRMGCSSVHDHFGTESDFALAVDSGTPLGQAIHERYAPALHDLGFYELIFLLALIAVLLVLSKIRKPIGFVPGFVALMYGPVRFFFEPFRLGDTDPRYSILGITPDWTFAQYVSVATIVAGAVALWWIFFKNPLYAKEGGGVEGLDAVLLGPPGAKPAPPARSGGKAAAKVAEDKPEPKKPSPSAGKKKGSGGKKGKGKKGKRKKR